MSNLKKLSDKQLLINYAITRKEYKACYAALKDLEEEMDRRVALELEKNRLPKSKGVE